MRVSNLLEFTENHRFVSHRGFSLGATDRKILSSLYQPMIGAFAVGLYYDLYHRIGEDEAGYGMLDAQRSLILGLGLEPNAAGRQTLAREASRLEAVGLLQVYRNHNPATEETLYEYALQRPLDASEFFANVHLTLLLRDKLGKPAVLALRSRLAPAQPAELQRFVAREEITTPFYELFRIGSGPIDPDLEPGWNETAPAREAALAEDRIRHADMLLRFPRGAKNRPLLEKLGRAPESMSQINYLAYKYDLDVTDICRLLDEDGAFAADGTLQWELLNRRAHSAYRQDRKRDEERERFWARGDKRGVEPEDEAVTAHEDNPIESLPLLEVPERFVHALSPEQYRALLRQEPYTRMLERYFPGAVPDSFVRIFERIDLNYKLPEPVINVLIHYLFGMKHAQRLTHAFIDSIASNMLAKGIDTYARAVAYIREQMKLNETLEKRNKGTDASGQSRARSQQQQRRKPEMPVVKDQGQGKEITPEQREKMLARARKLKGET